MDWIAKPLNVPPINNALFQKTTRTKLAASVADWRLLTSPIVEKSMCIFYVVVVAVVVVVVVVVDILEDDAEDDAEDDDDDDVDVDDDVDDVDEGRGGGEEGVTTLNFKI